ncbi:MAG: fibronectin type III domain-containing protein [Chloroflexota bacterium]|nr:fibronectin type III domain-containing protein [Chloroflexota bacterium]MDE2894706.1 fibronectin type III domain-containing protein [Chloroflexota bacterium]
MNLAAAARGLVALTLLLAGLLSLQPVSIVAQTGQHTGTTDPPSESPTSLAASIQSAGVTLTWAAPTLEADTVSGYRVSRKRILEYQTSWTTVVDDTDQTVTSYVDATANVNGAKYEYRVSALRGTGDDPTESGYSNVVTVNIPNPPRPLNLTASLQDTGVQLTWSAGHLSWQAVTLSLTGYEIRRIETAHPDNRNPEWEVLVANTNSTDTSYLDASGYTTIQYSYAIRAVHGYLHSYWEGIAGPVSGHLTQAESTEE